MFYDAWTCTIRLATVFHGTTYSYHADNERTERVALRRGSCSASDRLRPRNVEHMLERLFKHLPTSESPSHTRCGLRVS
eukprot:12073-Eustigmatos_ZCMA.PRE.1